MKNMLSQFQLASSNLTSIAFDVFPGVPTKTSSVSLKIGRSFNDEWSEDEHKATCECHVSVNCTWRSEDKNVDVCTASCAIRGTIIGSGIEKTEEVERYLHANAISFLYGKARTFIELVSCSSEVGILNIPAIVPLEMLDDDDDELIDKTRKRNKKKK